MFSTAFDASGTEHDQPILVVAGFVASAETWIDFDKAWRERLAKDGLPHFHMAEFVYSRGKLFGSWKNDPRRDPLLRDLVGLVQSHACRKFGCATVIAELHGMTTKARRQEWLMHAYPIAARAVVAQVRRWSLRENIAYPEIVFETGDHRQGDFVDGMIRDHEPVPILRNKTDRINNAGQKELGYTPLQAADILAYGCYTTLKNAERTPPETEWAYREFDSMLGTVTIWDEPNLQRLQERMDKETAMKSSED
jgi:hypothetical protein